MSSGDGEEVGGGSGEGGRGGASPLSNGEVLTNGDVMEMEVDGDDGDRGRGEEEEGEGSDEVINEDRSPVAIEKILAFGRDLQALHSRLSSEQPNNHLKTLLQVWSL